MNFVYLQFGSNLGDRMLNFKYAYELVEKKLGKIIKESEIYESEAWGMKDQPLFINSVVLINTVLSPVELLKTIKKIEDKLGRIRNFRWGPRTIDIDILFYNEEIIKVKDIEIPHRLIQHRRFVLIPLCEIANQFIHPVLKKKVSEILDNCEDSTKVWIYKPNN